MEKWRGKRGHEETDRERDVQIQGNNISRGEKDEWKKTEKFC